jgi:hypothetical protein
MQTGDVGLMHRPCLSLIWLGEFIEDAIIEALFKGSLFKEMRLLRKFFLSVLVSPRLV